jgi:signal peptidase I
LFLFYDYIEEKEHKEKQSGRGETMTGKDFSDRLRMWTEKYLTRRKRKKKKKEEKQKQKHIIREWIEAIVWALVIVILLQQFLFELYVIPTGSMIPTIAEGTRALVTKTVFGPEILPGSINSRYFREPRRGEVIVFENPDPNLTPMGPVKKIIHKLIFLITLTYVDIDADKYGRQKVRLLLKRVIGVPGDRLRMRSGNVQILPQGEFSWVTEERLKDRCRLTYPIRRIVSRDQADDQPLGIIPGYSERYAENPHKKKSTEFWRKKHCGWYIPENRFFPMGDNRDLSKDARYFGPVLLYKLIGKALFSFWPPRQFGPIN